MDLRGTLRRAAGLLIELPDEPEMPEQEREDTPQRREAMSEVKRVVETMQVNKPGTQTKTVEQIVRDSDGPNLDEIKAAPTASPILNSDGTVNYSSIYQAAKLPSVPFTAEQVLAMVNGLPQELPLEMKRQMVKVSITAMGSSLGATPENIVADTSRKLAALTAYTEYLTQQTTELTTLAEREIQNLQEQIAIKQKLIESAQNRQEGVVKSCTAESDRLDDILEFFSLDVPPSKYAPSA